VALFAGCDGSTQQNNSPTASRVTASYFSKNAIYLPDGAGIQFNGKLRSYALVENDKGKFDRYAFEFSEDIMAIEGAVFATLAKSGYQRKVRREDEKIYVVNYLKKGFPTITMSFERVPANKGMQTFTRLKVLWKNA